MLTVARGAYLIGDSDDIIYVEVFDRQKMLILVIFRGFGKFADRSQMADSVTDLVH